MRTREEARRVAEALRRKASSARSLGSEVEADAFATKAVEIEGKHGLNEAAALGPFNEAVLSRMLETIGMSPIESVFRDAVDISYARPTSCGCDSCRAARGL